MTRALFIAALSLAGCKTFDAGEYAPDPGTAPGSVVDSDTGDLLDDLFGDIDCETAPLVNWANFGNAFMIQNCNGCHASTTPERYGAPPLATFDTPEEVWMQKASVLYAAGGEAPRMPPSGGTTDVQRLKLAIWLECGTFGE